MKKVFLSLTMLLVIAVGSGLACSGWDCSYEYGQGYVSGDTGFNAQSGNGNVRVASDNDFSAYSSGDGSRYVHGSSWTDGNGMGYDDFQRGFLFSDAHSEGNANVYSSSDSGAHGYKGYKRASASVSGMAHQNNAAGANAFDFEGVTNATGSNYSQAEFFGADTDRGYRSNPHVWVDGGAHVDGTTDVSSYDFGPIAGAMTNTQSQGSAWVWGTDYGPNETRVHGAGRVAHDALADNNEWGGVPGNFAYSGAAANYSFDNSGYCGYIDGNGQANTYGNASTFSNMTSVNAQSSTSADASANTGGRYID